MANECDCCGSSDVEVTNVANSDDDSVHMCEICEGTIIGRTFHHPSNFENVALFKALAEVGNKIIQSTSGMELERLRKENQKFRSALTYYANMEDLENTNGKRVRVSKFAQDVLIEWDAPREDHKSGKKR